MTPAQAALLTEGVKALVAEVRDLRVMLDERLMHLTVAQPSAH